MRFAAIENGDLVSARERVTNLERSGEAGAAENQNAQRFRRLCFRGRRRFLCEIIR